MRATAILSMPNCGSDWFSECYAKVYNKSYFREYFNPVTNKKFEREISQAFGSEQVRNYKKIAHFDMQSCMSVMSSTWDTESYDMTKENYSAFKVEFFYQKFNCICLLRDLENSFPPGRLEVHNWYDAILLSMNENKKFLPAWAQACVEKASESSDWDLARGITFCVYRKILKTSCLRMGVPILKYEHLMQEVADVEKSLGFIEEEKRKNLVDLIFRTRKSASLKKNVDFRNMVYEKINRFMIELN